MSIQGQNAAPGNRALNTQGPSPAALWREHRIPMIALAAICLAIVAYGQFVSTNERAISAYVIGQNTARAIGIWLAFRYLIARDLRLGPVSVALIPIFASLLLSSHLSHIRTTREKDHFISHLQGEIQQLAAAGGMQDLAARPPPDIGGSDSGSYRVAEQVVSEFTKRMATDHAAYVQALEQAGLVMLLDPERLRNDAGFVESRRVIDESRRLIDLHQAKSRETEEWLHRRIDATATVGGQKDEFLEGFGRGLADSRTARESFWSMDREMVAELASVIELLASRSNWQLSEEGIAFESDVDAAAYNQHLARVDELADTQERIRAEAYEKTMRRLDAEKRAQPR